MKLFLHITASEEQPSFNTTMSNWVKENCLGVSYFDLDNKSDALVTQTAQTAIDKADKAFVLLENEPANEGAALKVLKHLIKTEKQKPVCIVLNSQNPIMEKLSRAFKCAWLRNLDETALAKEVQEFFNSNT